MAWSSGNIEKERLERFCIAWEFSQVFCTNDRLLVLKYLTLGTKISNELLAYDPASPGSCRRLRKLQKRQQGR
jgi:hypothetical protein